MSHYQKQIVTRLRHLKSRYGLRYWNEVARLAQMEPASLYSKVRFETSFSLDDIHALEKAFNENIIMIVGLVHHADD